MKRAGKRATQARVGAVWEDTHGIMGVGIGQDDFVCDVEGIFEDKLKDGKTIGEATRIVHEQFADALDDSEDGPLFWPALADMQWKYGEFDPAVMQHLKPSRPPGRVIRRPKFKAGDCLSIKLENGQYGAALVLKTDHANPEHGMDKAPSAFRGFILWAFAK